MSAPHWVPHILLPSHPYPSSHTAGRPAHCRQIGPALPRQAWFHSSGWRPGSPAWRFARQAAADLKNSVCRMLIVTPADGSIFKDQSLQTPESLFLFVGTGIFEGVLNHLTNQCTFRELNLKPVQTSYPCNMCHPIQTSTFVSP